MIEMAACDSAIHVQEVVVIYQLPTRMSCWIDWYESSGSTKGIHRLSCVILQWRHNGGDGISNHQPRDCLLNRLLRRRSKKTSKLRVTGLCAVNSPVTGEFPAQVASNAENVSIWWRHHGIEWYENSGSTKGNRRPPCVMQIFAVTWRYRMN